MNDSSAMRRAVIDAARYIHARQLTHGTTGNVSFRCGTHFLVTPTGCSLATVQPDELSLVDSDGAHIGGPKPSKEAFLHARMLKARPSAQAVVHTHSTHAAAVSCIEGLNSEDALPALTAYYAMRVGHLPLLPYYAPGDPELGDVAERAASSHHALLLSNHGPIVAGESMMETLGALEEIEETAKLFLLLRGSQTRPLNAAQRAALRPR